MSCFPQSNLAGKCFLRYLFSSVRIRPIIAILLPLVFVALISANAMAASVSVSWDENDPIPSGYIIHIRADGSSYNYDAPAWVGSATSCTIDGLIAGTTYFMVARAYNDAGQSADSAEITFVAGEPTPDTAESEKTNSVSETEKNAQTLIASNSSQTTVDSITNTAATSDKQIVTQLKIHLSSD